MIMRSRILRHWDVNDLFNDATAWMDNEMTCDLTGDLMARLVDVDRQCMPRVQEETENNKQIRASAQEMHNCVGTVL